MNITTEQIQVRTGVTPGRGVPFYEAQDHYQRYYSHYKLRYFRAYLQHLQDEVREASQKTITKISPKNSHPEVEEDAQNIFSLLEVIESKNPIHENHLRDILADLKKIVFLIRRNNFWGLMDEKKEYSQKTDPVFITLEKIKEHLSPFIIAAQENYMAEHPETRALLEQKQKQEQEPTIEKVELKKEAQQQKISTPQEEPPKEISGKEAQCLRGYIYLLPKSFYETTGFSPKDFHLSHPPSPQELECIERNINNAVDIYKANPPEKRKYLTPRIGLPKAALNILSLFTLLIHPFSIENDFLEEMRNIPF